MTPKEIGRLAGRLFNAGLPAHWALRNQEDQEDYGIDYEIELTTSNDQPTGIIFKVQQKGQRVLAINTAGDLISYGEICTQKLGYYLRDLKMPVVLVVVGVDAGESYWVTLQGNAQVETAYVAARAKEQKTATIHLPTRNKWPETSDRLLDAVRQAGDWLLVQQLRATSPQRFTSAAARAADIR